MYILSDCGFSNLSFKINQNNDCFIAQVLSIDFSFHFLLQLEQIIRLKILFIIHCQFSATIGKIFSAVFFWPPWPKIELWSIKINLVSDKSIFNITNHLFWIFRVRYACNSVNFLIWLTPSLLQCIPYRVRKFCHCTQISRQTVYKT